MKKVCGFFLTLFVMIFIGSHTAHAVVFNFGLNFKTKNNGDFKAKPVPFFDGDQTGFELDTEGVDRVRFAFDTSSLPELFVIDTAELYIDARGIAIGDDEKGVVHVRDPLEKLGKLNRLNRNVQVPLETGGRKPNAGEDPDDKDNSFFWIPSSRFGDIMDGSIGFRIRAKNDSVFKVDGANLQLTGHIVPEPSTLFFLSTGLVAFAFRRKRG